MPYLNTHHLLMNLPVVQDYFARRSASDADLNIFFQDEHNLVLPGGRGVRRGCRRGTIPSIFDDQEKYQVRVVNERQYILSDIIVEYNIPNIINILKSKKFPKDIEKKIVYGPSIPFQYSSGVNRGIDVLTNIINTQEPRRKDLLDKLAGVVPGYRNVQGIYDLPGLRDLYQSAKIVVNPHQTWHHHSIEEFRVLPALSQGCIVISEDVPLRTRIPYYEYVIWCSYEEIPEVTADVLLNYDRVFDCIHGHSGLPELLTSMLTDFDRSMDEAITASRAPESEISTATRLWRQLRYRG